MKEETKTNETPLLSECGPSQRSVKALQTEPERLVRKGLKEQMSFKSGVKGCGSDRWRERRRAEVTCVR